MVVEDKIGMINAGALSGYDQAKFELVSKNAERAKQRVEKLSGQGAKEVSSQRQEEIRNVATQFESLLLQQMLKSMWATVPSEGIMGGSREEEYYRDMLTEGLAESMAENQSIGVRDVIIKDLNRLDR